MSKITRVSQEELKEVSMDLSEPLGVTWAQQLVVQVQPWRALEKAGTATVIQTSGDFMRKTIGETVGKW